MYVTAVPNRGARPTVLLRESRRVDGKTKNFTLANLTCLPDHVVALLKRALAGEQFVPADGAFEITRSLPHGHVAAVLGTLKSCDLWDVLKDHRKPDQQAKSAALVVARVLDATSKLATAATLRRDTAPHSLSDVLALGDIDEEDLYRTLDWLHKHQDRIERRLARKHLKNGALILYDVSSSYLEGRKCALAHFGHNRDGKKGKLQITYGLLCGADGCPVAVEVFDGNTADPSTLPRQIEKLKAKFRLSHVVLVGDRGLITQARIDEDLKPNNINWITALRAPKIQQLRDEGSLQLSLFDDRDLAEITAPSFPNERLVVCRNPLLADERTRKREDLLVATEQKLQKIVDATQRSVRPLKGADQIGLRVGKVIAKYKVEKLINITITDNSFSYQRNAEAIRAEATLDGFYALRTNVPAEHLSSGGVVKAYKSLAQVERAFRCLKSIDLAIRPIHHRLEKRVRGHVFLCMLAYYVEWHMRQALAPLLYDDHDRAAADADRQSPVAKATRSEAAKAKERRHKTDNGHPVMSFRGCLKALGTLTRNTVVFTGRAEMAFTKFSSPTPFQVEALRLLDIKLTA